MRFDHTSLPFALRTCRLIDAAVETCRLTVTGLTAARVTGWTMRSAPTTTAASFEAPERPTVVGLLVASLVTVSVAVFGPIGSLGLNVTSTRQVPFGATAAAVHGVLSTTWKTASSLLPM